jgi:hypothetical protein
MSGAIYDMPLFSGAAVQVIKVVLCIQCSHTAATGRGNRLTIDRICTVASCKYTENISARGIVALTVAYCDIAVLHVDLILEHAGVGFMSNSDKDTAQIQLFGGAIVMEKTNTGYPAVVTEDLI